MGNSEMDNKQAKEKELKTSSGATMQESTLTTSAGTVNPDWAGFQAYSPMPHGFLASSPQDHPYIWGVQHIMPPLFLLGTFMLLYIFQTNAAEGSPEVQLLLAVPADGSISN